LPASPRLPDKFHCFVTAASQQRACRVRARRCSFERVTDALRCSARGIAREQLCCTTYRAEAALTISLHGLRNSDRAASTTSS
jgi:hypothetical protein